MRHQRKTKRLVRNVGHRNALLRNLAIGVLQHYRIKTTHLRAKEAGRFVEKLITMGKEDTLAARRRAFVILHDRSLVKLLFGTIAPLFTKRNGGYTRVIKLGFRRGDGAELALLELTEQPAVAAKKQKKSKKEAPSDQTKKKVSGEEKPSAPASDHVVHERPRKDSPKGQKQPGFMKGIRGMFKGKGDRGSGQGS